MDIVCQIANYKTAAYDWKGRLEATEQNKEYHGEGNVWIHTKLVIENLLADADYQAMDDSGQKVLLLAAILHDIAKPICTRLKNGVPTSPNHTLKGEIEARKLLYKYKFMEELFGKLSFFEREQVCSLVRHHGLPPLFLGKKDIQKVVCKVSLEIKPEYLYILSKADVKGRYSKTVADKLEILERFKEYCLANACFFGPQEFENATERLLYCKRSANPLPYALDENDKTQVFIMSGIPSSGKDTYIQTNLQNYDVISLDEIRQELNITSTENQNTVVQEAKVRAKKKLAQKESFVWNDTNTTERIRMPVIDFLLENNAFVEIIYTEAPVEEILKRNAQCEQPVSEDNIHKVIDCLEIPKRWESQSVTYFIQ